MKYDLPKRAEEDIIRLAQKNNIQKVILFGSRARGTNTERSDIDIAVFGGDVMNFHFDLEENAWTLLTFDVVDLNKKISDELQNEIARDGVILYEEV